MTLPESSVSGLAFPMIFAQNLFHCGFSDLHLENIVFYLVR